MLYRFDGFELDPAKRALRHHGELLTVPKKAFDVLVVLVENRERMVTKEDLLEAVWPQQSINENTLSQALTRLRSVLLDDPRDPAKIRTIHGMGFQWIEQVEVITAPASSADLISNADSGLRTRVGRLHLLLIFTGLGLLLLVLLQFSSKEMTPIEPVAEDNTRSTSGGLEQVVGILPVEVSADTLDITLVSGLDSLFQRLLGQVAGIRTLSPRLLKSPDEGLIKLQQRHGASHAVGLKLLEEQLPVLEVTLQSDLGQRQQRFQAARITELVQQGVRWVAQELGVAEDLGQPDDKYSIAGFYSQTEPYVQETFLRGITAYNRGEFDKALELFEVAVKEAPDFLVPRYELALTQRRLGLFDKSLTNLEVLLDLEPVPEVKVRVLTALITGYWRKGDLPTAQQFGDQAMALKDQVSLYAQTVALSNIALVKRHQGDNQGARRDLEQALRNNRHMDNTLGEAQVLNSLSGVYLSLGELGLAEQASLEAVSGFRAVNNLADLARALSRLGQVKNYQGDIASAKEYLQQAIEVNEEIDNRRGLMGNQLSLGEYAAAEGRYREAERWFSQARATAVETNTLLYRLDADNGLAKIALARKNFSQAESFFNQLLEGATSGGYTRLRVSALTGLGDIACQHDAPLSTAQDYYVQAHDLAVSRALNVPAVAVLMAQMQCQLFRREQAAAGQMLQRIQQGAKDLSSLALQNRIDLLAAEYYLNADLSQAESFLRKAADYSDTGFPYLRLLALKQEKAGATVDAVAALRQAKKVAGERWTDELENRLQAQNQQLSSSGR